MGQAQVKCYQGISRQGQQVSLLPHHSTNSKNIVTIIQYSGLIHNIVPIFAIFVCGKFHNIVVLFWKTIFSVSMQNHSRTPKYVSHFVWIAVVISTAIGTALKIAPGAPILGKESQYQRTNKLDYYFSILQFFFTFLMW